ncbi:MAG: putative lipoprotein [Myxococcaceae bacterium]|nr:putative lipoprotein [Myxococcaceae bacterium]
MTKRWGTLGLVVSAALFGCTSDSSGAPGCQFVSSSRSGGLCQLTLDCGGGPSAWVGLSCGDDSCGCVVNDRTGDRFPVTGACGQTDEALTAVFGSHCRAAPDAGAAAVDAARDVPAAQATCVRSGAVDLLFEIDNSNSMRANQAALARAFPALLDGLTNPPAGAAAVTSLHVGVISSDLGTPGSQVPSCANSEVGDDGLLNPIRYGQAIRSHQPWTTLPTGTRPSRCRAEDRNQYPSFLAFDAGSATARDDFTCNALLSIGGCGLEQQLEAAYRALVSHDPRERTGNADPNAGFVRDDAVLAIVMLTDEEDGSVRDCRNAETGVACTDALSVFDFNSTTWASPDLNLRGYLYAPGSTQDPTWPLDRYVDPARPARGFTSLKPGRPANVVFAAIAGVPLELPVTAAGAIDWTALLGAMPDGSDGYVGSSAEGPVSMRQRNMDPSCSTRVVPACRREGTSPTTSCDTTVQYAALPSRRIAEVARRFAVTYGTGTISSVCRNDYTAAVGGIAALIGTRLCAP